MQENMFAICIEGTYDAIKRNWASRCVTVGTVKGSRNKKTGGGDKGHGQKMSLLTCEKGWAMKKAKVGVRFSQPVKEFLNRIFMKGEETGQKANPAEVSSRLRNKRSTDGEKLFKRSEWLSVQQVTS